MHKSDYDKYYKKGGTYVIPIELFNELFDELERQTSNYEQALEDLDKKENIMKEVREDLHQVVKWCTENKHNEDTIERYLVVDYGTTVGKINEIRTKLDKENKQ